MQQTAEETLSVYLQLLPGLLEKLSRIPDPRNPNKVKHKMTLIILYGILMFVYQIPSRRKANQELTTPHLLQNLKAVFPEIEDMPHQSTLCRLLEKMDVDSIETAYTELLKQNIRKKRFKNLLRKNRYLVAVDGTQSLLHGRMLERTLPSPLFGAKMVNIIITLMFWKRCSSLLTAWYYP